MNPTLAPASAPLARSDRSRASTSGLARPASFPSAAPITPSTLRPAAAWVEHFRTNRLRDWQIPWSCPVPLASGEAARIAASIAEFQRGESSEARHYLQKSARFALERGDAAFHEASLLFVREENEHAALLLRFMNGVGLPSRKEVLSDGVFRRLRALSDLGWASRVLLVAELVAQEYYPALRADSAHPVLRRVCAKLIHDEFAHIRFQVERIVRLEAELSPARRRLRDWLQGLLLVGATLVVYRGHRGVLRRLGLRRFAFGLKRRFCRVLRARRLLARAVDLRTSPLPHAVRIAARL